MSGEEFGKAENDMISRQSDPSDTGINLLTAYGNDVKLTQTPESASLTTALEANEQQLSAFAAYFDKLAMRISNLPAEYRLGLQESIISQANASQPLYQLLAETFNDQHKA